VLSLNLLPVGRAAVIHELELPDAVEHHLMHMGFTPEARVVAVRRAPAGDPTVYSIDGMEIALRRETACGILVEPAELELAEPEGMHTAAGGEDVRVRRDAGVDGVGPAVEYRNQLQIQTQVRDQVEARDQVSDQVSDQVRAGVDAGTWGRSADRIPA
jgi:ferrous iron transport protein A